MRILPANRDQWFELLLFPFKLYLPLGIVCLLVWKVVTEGHRLHGSLAQAATPVLFGYTICIIVFLALAAIRFFTHHRQLVAETLLLAAIAIIIASMLAPWCANS